ncbi:MAG: hypothetical protein JWP27_629, partial [Flaviaesturariibacter sp.]|nr:hypothetical protein [Flaviaesturariibacter sp.]
MNQNTINPRTSRIGKLSRLFSVLALLVLATSALRAQSPLCASSPNSFGYEYVTQVCINGACKPGNTGYAGPGYIDYTGTNLTNLVAGQTYPVSVTVQTNAVWQEYVKIWFDFNGNGDLQDAGELVFNQVNSWSGVYTFSGNVTVPTTAFNGSVYIRVVMTYAASPTLCGSYAYGNTMDFKATISGGLVSRKLTVSRTGPASALGNVVSTPAGINTAAGINSANFTDGSNVTLTASNGATGSFQNYTGDASGTSPTASVSLTGSDKAVTANYADVPAVSTTVASGVTTTSASGGGTVTTDNNASVSARGVCWNTTGSPTIADPTAASGSGTGAFTSTLAPLSPNTTYFYRAYATNAVGTGYGAQQSLLTLPSNPTSASASSSSICSNTGASVTLTAAGVQGTATWSTSCGGAVIGTGTTLVVSPASTTTYFVWNVNAAGASAGCATVTVIVNTPATPTVTSPTSSFCAGGAVVLTSSAGSAYQWLLNGSPIAGATGQTYAATAGGQYAVRVTDGNGCTAQSADKSIVMNTPATPSLTMSPSSGIFCTGGSVTLASSVTGTYVWKRTVSSVTTTLANTTQSILASTAGSYTVTVTDANGCSATSAAAVVTAGGQPLLPNISGSSTAICPGGTATLAVANVQTGITYSWTPVTGLSSTLSPTVTASPATTTSYLVTATNSFGCARTATAPAIVTVNTVPVMTTCPQNISANASAQANTCNAVVSYTVVASGTPAPAYTYTATGATNTSGSGTGSGTTFSRGVTTVTVSASNGCGAAATCTFTVTVVDVTPPSILCPAALTVSADPGLCGAFITVTGGGGGINNRAALSSTAKAGEAVVTTTSKDATLGATSGPVLSRSVSPAQFVPVVSDNCTTTITGTRSDGQLMTALFPIGVTTVTWTVRDGANLSASCNQLVTVTDDEDPVLVNLPANISVPTDNNLCSAVVGWTPPTATDNCTVTLTTNHNPGEVFPAGVTTVTYVAKDASQRTVSGSFTVTVTDTQAPSITCPANKSVASCSGVMPDYTTGATVSDNCTPTGSIVITQFPTAGTPIAAGTSTTVTLFAKDAAGNQSSCTFIVTVQSATTFTTTTTKVSCPGSTDGSITVVATGGNGTYQYSIDGGAFGSASTFSGLAAGSHNIKVISNGCESASEAVVVTTTPDVTPPVLTLNANGALTGLGTVSTYTTLVSGSGTGGLSHAHGIAYDLQRNTVWVTDQDLGNDVLEFAATQPSGSTVPVLSRFHPVLTSVIEGIAFDATDNTLWIADFNGYIGHFSRTGTALSGSFNVSSTIPSGTFGARALGVGIQDNYIWVDNGVRAYKFNKAGGTYTGFSFATGQPGITYDPERHVLWTSAWNDNRFRTYDPSTGVLGFTSAAIALSQGHDLSIGAGKIWMASENSTRDPFYSVAINGGAIDQIIECHDAYTDPGYTATDNCTVNPPVTVAGAVNTNTPGTYTLTYNATDGSGNSTTATRTVTVLDRLPAVPNVATLPVKTGECSVTVTAPTATDVCAGTITATTPDPVTYTAQGTYTIHWTYSDGSGNTTTQNQTVIVSDVTPPTITCPSNKVLASCTGTLPNYTSAAVVSDNCTPAGSIIVTQSPAAGTPIAAGTTTTVTLTATDAAGKSSTCSFTVTTRAAIAFTATTTQASCPSSADATINVSATGGNGTYQYSISGGAYGPVGSFPNLAAGTYAIKVSSDGCESAVQNIVVTAVPDVTAPVIACPFNITVNAAAGACGAVVNYSAPSATDNCGTGTLPTSITGYTYKGTFGGHTYFLSNTTTTPEDAHAKAVALGGHLVTINSAAENAFVAAMNPNFIWIGFTDRAVEGTFKWITNEPVVYTNWNAGEPNNVNDEDWAVINWGPNGSWNDWQYYQPALFAVEFEGGNIPTTKVSGLGSGATFPIGTSTETWQAVDASGNVATCSFTVTVVDNQLPTITAPAAITVSTNPGTCSATGVVLGTPVVSDNCPAGLTYTNNAPASFPKGNTTVTWVAKDASGNTASATQVVTVKDNEAPKLTGVPANATVECNAVPAPATVTATDNCSFNGIVSYTEVRTNGACPSSYTLTRTWSATDASSNTTTASQVLTVVDTQAPALTVPGPITKTTDAGSCGAIVTYATTATDNCGTPAVTYSRASGASFPVGETTVTVTATDACGNQTVKTFTVTVTDNEAPSITCAPNVSNANDAGACGATISLATPATADNCGVQSVTNDHASPFYPVGSTTVTWTVTDIHGNSNTCTQTVTISDTEKPVITTCPAAVSVFTNSGCTATGVALGTPAGTDNCGVVTFTNNAPAAFSLGTTTVTWTATDAHGNTATCTQVVTVTDNVKPVITTCPAAVTAFTNNGCTATGVVLGTPAGTDNCGTVTFTSDAPASFPLGNTTVTWTANDGHGNTTTCTQVVTVKDNIKPTITCPAPQTINLDANCGALLPDYRSLATVADNCTAVGSLTITQSPAAGSSVQSVGSTLVTITVTDASGNSESCSFSV